MPAVYKNATSASVPPTRTPIYTVPAGATAIVNNINVCDLGAETTVSIWAAGVLIGREVPIPRGNPYEATERNPYVLMAGESIDMASGTGGGVSAYLSAIEES